MKNIKFLSLLLLLVTMNVVSQKADDIKKIQQKSNLSQLLSDSEKYAKEFKASKERALTLAKSKGWKIIIEENGIYSELIGVTEDDKPLYYSTSNIDAAKSTRTDHLNIGGSLGLNLMGINLNTHVWDGGIARATHQEYDGLGGNNRYSIGDGTTLLNFHAAHVTGTIMSSGFNANAKGMAPYSRVTGYDWNSDLSEATVTAANGMLISNHSYGYRFSDIVQLKPSWFGAYIQKSADWDNLMSQAPYYLMVVAAGNDGNNFPPNPLLSGYDKLTGHTTSKNNLVVANAQDANIDSNGNLISVSINSSSSQGPTDDLRVKPDITGNGTGVYSTYENNDSDYGSITGTSMASPNVSGTLLLLQEHYRNLHSNFMRASTLKGLALHTADDTGITGPDAIGGWGLLNSKKAAETITQKGSSSIIDELTITQGQTISINVNSDGMLPLIASISWTDLPGLVSETLNNNTPRLINDLDIRITQNTATTFPWRLTSANTNSLGDNNHDPFERINVINANGNYIITITHKGTISGGSQNFSLIVTGISNCPDELNISTNVTSGTDMKQASQTITATNSINSGAGAIYSAPTVSLKPPFNSNAGSTLSINTAGCSNTSLYMMPESNIVSYRQKDENSFKNNIIDEKELIVKISPNPNNGIFKISINKNLDGLIEVSDLNGINIFNAEFKNLSEYKMNLQDRPKGIYIVKVTIENQVTVQKIIKN